MSVRVIVLLTSIAGFGFACAIRNQAQNDAGNQLQAEVDSFTPRSMNISEDTLARALKKLDDITNLYLYDAVAWANQELPCDSRCLAMLISETLASTLPRNQVKSKLEDIRRGTPYKRWGHFPTVPGWRGFQGELEHLLSRGRSRDGRYTFDEGLVRLPFNQSIFRNTNRLDSPGSAMEIGSILPIDLPSEGVRIYVGSDKFGHFLSTGFEYFESYLETYDETLQRGLTEKQAQERAEFATYVRGVLTEVTSLGGWLARVFSYADLAANQAGFIFFKDIFDGRSPYFKQDAKTGKWSRTETRFSWRQFIDPAWDEGINCSHYFDSVGGDNQFQRKVAKELVELKGATGESFVCPIRPDICKSTVASYQSKYGSEALKALISPQCLDVAQGRRQRFELTEKDLNNTQDEFNAMGFYSGEYIVRYSQEWCRNRRDWLIADRCASVRSRPSVEATCRDPKSMVTSEGFRCQLDMKDFLGWSF